LTPGDGRSARTHLPLGVIADDITGALDTGVQFAEAGLETTLLLSTDDSRPVRAALGQVQVLSTDSRDGDAATARRRAVRAADRLRGAWLYKKIDSTMRGHVGPEIGAVLQTAGLARAVVCPAVIGQGRTVRDGKLWVGDTLLHQSDFGRDPVWPARTSDVVALLGVPATHLPLHVVRAGPESLAGAILGAPTPLVTVDAVEEADVERTARAAILAGCLPCGALGLARAWIECLIAEGYVRARRTGDRPIPARSPAPILIVAGSRHPATSAQVQRAAAARDLVVVGATAMSADEQVWRWTMIADALAGKRSVVVRSPLEEMEHADERRALGEAMAGLARRACREYELGGLVLTGGETALAVCRALGATAIDILGELEVGIPWGRLCGGVAPGTYVVTKAGGFGRPDSLVRIVDALYDRQDSQD
jgi:uncharacterized protein YgbK (DUF1537 family)